MVIAADPELSTVNDVRFAVVSVVMVCAPVAESMMVSPPARASVNVVMVVIPAPAKDNVLKLASENAVMTLAVELVSALVIVTSAELSVVMPVENVIAPVPAKFSPDKPLSARVVTSWVMVLLFVIATVAWLSVSSVTVSFPVPEKVREVSELSVNAVLPIKLVAVPVWLSAMVSEAAVSLLRVEIVNPPVPEMFSVPSLVSVNVVMTSSVPAVELLVVTLRVPKPTPAASCKVMAKSVTAPAVAVASPATTSGLVAL